MKKIILAACLSLASMASYAQTFGCYSLEGSRAPLFAFIIGNETLVLDEAGVEVGSRNIQLATGDEKFSPVVAHGKASEKKINLVLLQNGQVVGEIKARANGVKNQLAGTIKLQGLESDHAHPIGCIAGK